MNANVPTQEQLYRGGWKYVTVTTGLVVRVNPLVARGWTLAGTQAGIVELPDARNMIPGFHLILVNESSVAHSIRSGGGSVIEASFTSETVRKLYLASNATADGRWVQSVFPVLMT